MKKLLVSLLCTISIVILTLCYLFWTTKLPNQNSNGFTRKWLASTLSPIHQKPLQKDVFQINGATDHRYYFSSGDPRWIIVTDTNLQTVDTLTSNIVPTELTSTVVMEVDSPNIYWYANNISYLASGVIGSPILDTVRLHTALFTRLARISSNLLVIRGFDSTQSTQVFKQLNCKTGSVNIEASITEDQNDFGFGTDGILKYDVSSNKLIYAHTYSNQLICMDTNLKVLYRSTTIDTIHQQPFSHEFLMKDNSPSINPSKARQTVNHTGATHNGYLFIASDLRADNEKLSDFNRNVSIDIYHINTGKYSGSFLIPKLKKKNIVSLFIHQQTLVAIYENGLAATYHLPSY